MDELARRLVIARGDGIAHQRLLNELSQTDLLILDDFLTVGIDSDAASDLFAILANREHRLPTVIASQTGPGHWLGELPDRVAADSIVNRLANHARTINLGDIDMRRLRHDHARADKNYWGVIGQVVPAHEPEHGAGTTSAEHRYQVAGLPIPTRATRQP